MLMGVVACGKTNNTNDGSNTSNTSNTSNSDHSLESESQAETYTLSSSFSTASDSIWYYVSDDEIIGKDTEILKLFVFKDGELKIHNNYDGNYSLGDFAKMTDEEIIQTLEEYQAEKEKNIQENVDNLIADYDKLLQMDLDLFDKVVSFEDINFDFTAIKSEIEKAKNECSNFVYPTSEDVYQIAIYTDHTGNTTTKETISYSGIVQVSNASSSRFQEIAGTLEAIDYMNKEGMTDNTSDEFYDVYLNYEYLLSLCKDVNEDGNTYIASGFGLGSPSAYVSDDPLKINLVNGIDSTRGSTQIYDSYYGGYICEDRYLITRSDNTVNFVLDPVGTEGIEVDPK